MKESYCANCKHGERVSSMSIRCSKVMEDLVPLMKVGEAFESLTATHALVGLTFSCPNHELDYDKSQEEAL